MSKIRIVDVEGQWLSEFNDPGKWLQHPVVIHSGGNTIGAYAEMWPSLVFPHIEAYIHAKVVSYQGVSLLTEVSAHYPSVFCDETQTGASPQFFERDEYPKARQFCLDWIIKEGRPWMRKRHAYAAWVTRRRVARVAGQLEAVALQGALRKFSTWCRWLDDIRQPNIPLRMEIPDHPAAIEAAIKAGATIL